MSAVTCKHVSFLMRRKRSSMLRTVAVATTWTLTTSRCRPRLVFKSFTTGIDRATTTCLVGQGKLNMNTVKRTDPFEVIAAYTPKVVTEERWSELSGFVRTAVGNAVEETWTADRTRNALRLVTKLCNFVLRTGRDLSVEAVFTDDMVSAFSHNELASDTTHVRGSSRAVLRKVGLANNPDFDAPRLRPEYGSDSGSAPYTESEISALRVWANGERTEERRRQAHLLLALTLGAGLRSCEVAGLTASDVSQDSLGLTLLASGYRGAAERVVPVEHEWANTIAEAVEHAAGEGSWLFRPRRTTAGHGTVATFTKRSFHPTEAVDVARARTTWVVNQVRKGVPETAVLQAAGLHDLQHYRRFISAPEHSEDHVRALLHGTRVSETHSGLTLIQGAL